MDDLDRFYCFEADLTPRWDVSVQSVNIVADFLTASASFACNATELRLVPRSL